MEKGLKRTIAFIGVIFGYFMALLDSTILNIAIPDITRHFNASVDLISWVVNGYNLAFAVLMITASRIADQFGRKKIFAIGLILFAFSSFMVGMSQTIQMLIAFRVLQGLAAAIVVPVTIPIVAEMYPKEMHGTILGIWGATSGIAAASGPVIGGVLTQSFGWSSVFFVNLPIGAVSLIITLFLLRESYDNTSSRNIDWGGMLTLSLSIFASVLVLIKINEWGWTSFNTLALFGVSLISFILFVIIETKVKEPLLPVWILKNRFFTSSCLTLFILGAGIMITTFFMSFFLTRVQGMSILEAGLVIASMPLTSIVFSSLSGPFSNKNGSRLVVSVGMLFMTVAVVLYTGLTGESNKIDIIWRLVIFGIGLGLSMAPVIGASVRHVPADKVGISSGITNMSRAIGSIFGVAIFVLILNTGIQSEVALSKGNIQEVINQSSLNQEIKTKFISKLGASNLSNNFNSQDITGVLSELDKREKELLKKASDSDKELIRENFRMQRTEVQRVFPQIATIIKNGFVAAFRRVFSAGAIIMFLGVIFGWFCDKRKEEQLCLV